MANNKRRARVQAVKSNRPSSVTGKPHLRSADTNAFLDGIGRLGGTMESKKSYVRKPKHASQGWSE